MSIKTLCVTFGFSLSSTWPYYQHHDPTKWQTETLLARCQVTAQAPLGKKQVNMPHQQSIPGLWFYSLLKGFKHFLSNIDTHPHRLHCSALPPRFFAEELDHDAASELSVIGCERDVKSKSGLLIRGRERVRIMT